MEIEERTPTAQGERAWRISQRLCAFHDGEAAKAAVVTSREDGYVCQKQ